MADVTLDLHEKQWEAFETKATELLYGGAAGGGKAESITAMIPTADGWSTMGDIKVGDQIFDENGEICNVIATTEVMYDRPCYKLTFDDGTEIITDAEHQWWTFTDKEREQARRLTPEFREKRRIARAKRGTGKRPDLVEINQKKVHDYKDTPNGSVKLTKDIAASILASTIAERLNHSIPLAKGVQYGEKQLPLDPYVLGAWLGDGNSNDGGITSDDPEIIRIFEDKGFEVTKRKSKYLYGVLGLARIISDMGLKNNKHIPHEYLQGSYAQRLSLLQGLCDTDGHCDKRGKVEFSQSRKEMSYQVLELVNSLGIKATINSRIPTLNGVKHKRNYRITFRTEQKVFRLKRKQDRVDDNATKLNSRCKVRYITGCEPVDSVPVRCIQVDSKNSLYLTSKSFIPTHNSHLMRVAAISWCLAIPDLQVYLFRRTYKDLNKNHMEGSSGFPRLLSPWIESKYVKINHSNGQIIFGNGAKIHLCHCQYEKDVIDYQGSEIHLLLIDELTHFTEKIYKFLRSRCRLGGLKIPEKYKGVFPRIICGANPGGIGHNFVKRMFVSIQAPMKVKKMGKTEGGMLRQFIPALLEDNPTMAENDPDYEDRLEGLGNPALVKAMRRGDWDIVSGGMFDDVWDRNIHCIEPFAIPASFYVDRSFDWGSSAPFSCLWWCEASGETITLPNGDMRIFPSGTIFLIAEWYGGKDNVGLKMTADEIATGIVERENGYIWGSRVHDGPADPNIYSTQNDNCIADDMESEGVSWTPGENSPGSRSNGAEKLRTMMKASKSFPMERPGIFIFEDCVEWISHIPVLPRAENKQNDVDTKAEDHDYDATRYRILKKKLSAVRQTSLSGW